MTSWQVHAVRALKIYPDTRTLGSARGAGRARKSEGQSLPRSTREGAAKR